MKWFRDTLSLMVVLLTLGLAMALLAGFDIYLWLELRNQGRWWSARFEGHLASMNEIRSGVDRLRQRFDQNLANLSEIRTHIDALAGQMKLDWDTINKVLDSRLDAVEARLDIPKARQRLRAPFSQLRHIIRQEQWKPEPSRYDNQGNEVPNGA